MFSSTDFFYMQRAIQLANQAIDYAEVPVGAVLVLENTILGEGWNQPISSHDPTAHAEIIALRNAGKNIENYRLVQSTLYVTLEPCIMCVGALIHARIKRLVYGASDPKKGGLTILEGNHLLNHSIEYQGGLLADECGSLLKSFFQARRCNTKEEFL